MPKKPAIVLAVWPECTSESDAQDRKLMSAIGAKVKNQQSGLCIHSTSACAHLARIVATILLPARFVAHCACDVHAGRSRSRSRSRSPRRRRRSPSRSPRRRSSRRSPTPSRHRSSRRWAYWLTVVTLDGAASRLASFALLSRPARFFWGTSGLQRLCHRNHHTDMLLCTNGVSSPPKAYIYNILQG